MAGLLLGVAGRIGSGKTTVSRELAAALRVPHASFGEYVRGLARARGLATTREALQALGESEIAERGWEGFCRDALKQAGWHAGGRLVLDGIRHVEVSNHLRRIAAPARFVLVFLRDVRARTAEPVGIRPIECHSTEREVVATLPGVADLIVDNADSPAGVAREILDWLMASQAETPRQ